jgi:hypothetical protein
MSEYSVWYVPQNQEALAGRAHEVADAFWERGIFLSMADDCIYRRIDEWKASGRALPQRAHDFAFSEMGLTEEEQGYIVPNLVYELCCPKCKEDLTELAYEVFDDESQGPVEQRLVVCLNCDAEFPASELKSAETPFTFAMFYIWVGDIDVDDWGPAFKETVEKVLGPCGEFIAWET